MRLGIVGGDGKMGKLFAPIFERYVDEVITSLDPINIAKSCDIIVFSVPIEVTEKVIEELLPHIEERHLLMDFTSLKEGPCKAMMHSQGSVIGLHPLFGPSVSSIRGMTINGTENFNKGCYLFIISMMKFSQFSLQYLLT